MAISKIQAQSINLADTFAFSGTVTGAGKLINSSRVLFTGGTVSVNSASLTDTGIDHTYTGASTSNKLLHIINGNWRKSTEGGSAGGITIYAADSAITEINAVYALGEWAVDSATTDVKGGSVTYMTADIASTSAIKYSIYFSSVENTRIFPLYFTSEY